MTKVERFENVLGDRPLRHHAIIRPWRHTFKFAFRGHALSQHALSMVKQDESIGNISLGTISEVGPTNARGSNLSSRARLLYGKKTPHPLGFTFKDVLYVHPFAPKSAFVFPWTLPIAITLIDYVTELLCSAGSFSYNPDVKQQQIGCSCFLNLKKETPIGDFILADTYANYPKDDSLYLLSQDKVERIAVDDDLDQIDENVRNMKLLLQGDRYSSIRDTLNGPMSDIYLLSGSGTKLGSSLGDDLFFITRITPFAIYHYTLIKLDTVPKVAPKIIGGRNV